MTDTRRLVLATRPSGMCDSATVRIESLPVPEPAEGEAVVKVQWLSIDPTIRTWMDDAPGFRKLERHDGAGEGAAQGFVIIRRIDDHKMFMFGSVEPRHEKE